MVLVTKFCFWFPIRLGVIVIGVFTMIQASVWIMICFIGFYNLEEVKSHLYNLIHKLSLRSKFFDSFASDPKVGLIIFMIFFSLLMLSCVLLLYESFACKPDMLIVFIVVDLLYIIFLLIGHIFLMLMLKKQEIGLGSLILYSNIGGFFCMYLLYMWICVISFREILKNLRIEHRTFRSRTESILIPIRSHKVRF